MKLDEKSVSEQYKDFCNVEMIQVPDELNSKILSDIKRKILRHKIFTLIGVFAIHVFTGATIIAICPQFGIQYFDNFLGIKHIFMMFGENACSFFCGSLFISTSMVVASLILPKTAQLFLYSIRYFNVLALTLISLFFFHLLQKVSFDVGLLFWALGALVCGSLATKMLAHTTTLKQKFQNAV